MNAHQLKNVAPPLMLLMESVSAAEMRAIGLEAMRRWRKVALKPSTVAQQPVEKLAPTLFQLHDRVGIEIVLQLAERKGVKGADAAGMKELFIDEQALQTEWMSVFVEFTFWLESAGIAVRCLGQRTMFPVSMMLTARGAKLLDAGDDDPLLPGFLDRIKARCPGLPDGVLALLVDARACLDRYLMRAAVILMGVAYELAIEAVVDKLITKGLVNDKTLELEAKKRLDRVRELIKDDTRLGLVVADSDDRRRVVEAYAFADQLRLERNGAAHTRPTFDYVHAAETEEFLVSAGRHLPSIWLLAGD